MKRNNFITFILVPLISLSFFACSKDLSRGKAEELISQKLNLPQPETMQFDILYVEGDIPWNLTHISKQEENMLNYFSNNGLITIQKIPHVTDFPGPMGGVLFKQNWKTIKAELTNEGRKYLVGQNKEKYIVKICELSFGEVTGIQTNEQYKIAEVSYTLKRGNMTPFAINVSQNPINRTATFSLYDDGWRIK